MPANETNNWVEFTKKWLFMAAFLLKYRKYISFTVFYKIVLPKEIIVQNRILKLFSLLDRSKVIHATSDEVEKVRSTKCNVTMLLDIKQNRCINIYYKIHEFSQVQARVSGLEIKPNCCRRNSNPSEKKNGTIFRIFS